MFRTLVASVGLALVAIVPQTPRSLVILNARVFTGDPTNPWAEAVRIDGERITHVGTTADIRAAGAVDRTIDAAGRLLVPGINDAHAHPSVNPPGATVLDGPPVAEHEPTFEEIVDRINRAAPGTPDGRWLVGEVGEAVLDDPRSTRQTFDPLTGARPLILHSWTGHGSIYNTAALRALGVRLDEPADRAGPWMAAANPPVRMRLIDIPTRAMSEWRAALTGHLSSAPAGAAEDDQRPDRHERPDCSRRPRQMKIADPITFATTMTDVIFSANDRRLPTWMIGRIDRKT